MHKINSGKFFKALEQACVTHQTFKLAPALPGAEAGVRLGKRDHEEKMSMFGVLADECAAIGLLGAAASIRRAMDVWKDAPSVDVNGEPRIFVGVEALARIQVSLSQATSRIPDDLESQVLLALDPRKVHLYEDARPFGDEVFNTFVSVRDDAEDAAKCLAFEQGTACVFHVMRALEGVLHVVADKIGAAIKDQHGKGLPWGVIADNMKSKIDAMPKGSDDQIKWYRVQQELVVINRAWRVPTNHPKERYTVEEAQEVFDATKTFMKDLVALA